jgi:hypothetical protein
MDKPESSWAGAMVTILGAAIVAVATFLPLDEPGNSFARVQGNTLIQHGGWWLVVIGVALAVSSVSGKRWATVLLSLICAAVAAHFALDKSLRTLYPINSNGEAEGSAAGTVVPLGIAVYVAGAGAVVALVGSLFSPGERRSTAACPECAETILAAATVCKHCGSPIAHAQSEPPEEPAHSQDSAPWPDQDPAETDRITRRALKRSG